MTFERFIEICKESFDHTKMWAEGVYNFFDANSGMKVPFIQADDKGFVYMTSYEKLPSEDNEVNDKVEVMVESYKYITEEELREIIRKVKSISL